MVHKRIDAMRPFTLTAGTPEIGSLLLLAIADLARLLNAKEDCGEMIDKALEALGRTLGAENVFLFKKHFEGVETFSLMRIGTWPPWVELKKDRIAGIGCLQPQNLPPAWWDKLKAQTPVFEKKSVLPIMDGIANLLLIPLFLETHLFGFIALINLKGDVMRPPLLDFFVAVGHIFGLAITKLALVKRQSDIINSVPFPTFIMSSNGRVTAWNKAVEDLTGWEAERVVGKGNCEHAIPFYGERRPTASNLILDPDPSWETKYIRFRRQGDTAVGYAYCPSLPGGGGYVTGKTSRIYDSNNRIWGAIHSVRDVTRERKIELELQRSESVLRAIIDFAHIGIMLFQHKKILYYNDRFAELIGIFGRKIRFLDLIDWIRLEDGGDDVRGRINRLLQGEQTPWNIEFSVQDGKEPAHYRGYAQAIRYEDRPTIHFIVEDITEQKELSIKARINEIRMYHEDRLTSLGTLAAGIAHELNQPLNAIRVIADGLLFGRDSGWRLNENELFENMEMISKQVLRMTAVIRSIRDFGRENRVQAMEEVNINTAVENVFSIIGGQLEAHNIMVSKRTNPALPSIEGCLNRLEQVFMNLIVNSRQALDGCMHDHKELWIRTDVEDGWVIIEVGDNATGIPETSMKKIFEPFFTTKEAGEGTGLGLSIVQSIVGQIKGRIDVRNNDKGGASFIVSLPAMKG